MKILKYNFPLLFLSILCTITISIQAQTLYWQKLTPDYYVYDMLYDGQQNLYFSGASGNYYFWRSTDLGLTWTRLGNGDLRLYRIAMDSSGVLWGGCDPEGGIYKSTNQGDSWTNTLPTNDRIFSITVSPNNWIWAGSYGGKIIYSSNSGETWEDISIANDIIYSVISNPFNQVFAGSGDGEIFRTTNLSSSWELVYNSTEWLIISGMVVDSSNYIYATAYGQSKRLLSLDNGNTWLEILGPNLESLYINAYHNFWGSSGYSGYRSLDNCLSWQSVGPTWPNCPNSLTFIDSLVFAGTSDGVFLYDPSYQPYIGDNYFPLNIGNIWQFNNRCNGHSAGNSIYFIEKDTIIQNKRYFLLEGSVNDLVFYNDQENIFYLRWNDSDYVVMNFTLNEGSVFQRILFNSHQLVNVEVVEPTYINIFDSSYHSKGSTWGYSGPPAQAHTTYYSENLGETIIHSYYDNIGGGSSYCDRKMIRAIINDSAGTKYYSDHVAPEISFQPIFVIPQFEFNLDLTVDHLYSYFSQYSDINFIDSVILFSYYSNGDSIIMNNQVLAENEPSSINYTVSLLLDSTLLKNDYKFYYKIYAVDKGIVPEHSTKPDTGYYELIYDPNVSVEIFDNKIIDYSLEQNHPNPFNPATIIEYSIKEEGNVELVIYDVLGKVVVKLLDERKLAGNYSVQFDASNLSSGIYFYSLRINDFADTKKMLLLK